MLLAEVNPLSTQTDHNHDMPSTVEKPKQPLVARHRPAPTEVAEKRLVARAQAGDEALRAKLDDYFTEGYGS